MKFFVLAIITVLLPAHLSFSQNKNPSVALGAPSEIFAKAKRAIDKGNAEWIEAWEKGSPERIAAIFTDDAVMLSRVASRFLRVKKRQCKASLVRLKSR
jgi:hypothetical protein